MTNSTGTVTLAKSYDPYGAVTHTNGVAQSAYGFTGEQADVTGLTYLRARYYSPLHMGLPEAEVRARVDMALEAVRMSSYKDRLSHHLSVGEKKRIAIATVLSMNPSLLILDEPSAGLDPRARRTLINLLRELPITMLVSTHDMKLVQELFPRTIVMDEGLVVADGLTMEILENEDLLTAHGLEKP